MVEQAHSTLYSRLTALQSTCKTKSWARLLPYAAFSMNAVFSRGIRFAPSAVYHNSLDIMRVGFLADKEWNQGLSTFALVGTYDDDLYCEDAEDHPNTSDLDGSAEDEWMEDFDSEVDESEFIGPGLTDQATVNRSKARDEMLRRNGKKLRPLPVGATIKIEIPKEDRGKLGTKWLVGKVLSITHNGNSKIITEHGTLNKAIQRKHLYASAAVFTAKAVTTLVPMTTAFRQASGWTVTGSTRCSCQNGCKGTCSCVKTKISCTIACHKDRAHLCTNHSGEEPKVERTGIPKRLPKVALKFPISIFRTLKSPEISTFKQIVGRCVHLAPIISTSTNWERIRHIIPNPIPSEESNSQLQIC